MMTDVSNPFWDYSWEVYHRPGVAEACLALQGRHGLDVNLLLFCCWAGQCGHRFEPEQITRLVHAVQAWHGEVVRPLRSVRQWLKSQGVTSDPAVQEFRDQVKAQELKAEWLEQALLHEAFPFAAGEAAPGAAMENVCAYLECVGVQPDVADAADLAAILVAAFSDGLRPLNAIWRLDEHFLFRRSEGA